MSDDIDPAAIQREINPRAAPLCLLRRLSFLGVGLLLGAAFSLFVAGPLMPPGMSSADRFQVWASVMGGPIVGTAWGMAEFHPSIGLGWLGLLLIPAHPLRPSALTGCVTIFGIFLWLFAGFLTMIAAVWGA